MNQKIDKAKTNNKKKKKSEFLFCKVCNLNHDQGQRHKYFSNHNKSLSAFLSRFRRRLSDILFFLKNPSVLRPEHASCNCFCANAINHLASADHVKNIKHFLWKYGGGMDRVDTFRFLEADVVKWNRKCESLENEAASPSDGSHVLQVASSKDIQNDLKDKNIINYENNNFDRLKLNLSNVVMPLQYYKNKTQISHSGLSAVTNVGSFTHDAISSMPLNACSVASLRNSNDLTVNCNSQQPLPYKNVISSRDLSDSGLCQVYQGGGMVNRVNISQGSHNISQISAIPPENAGGNVHAGAIPPWFDVTEENQLNDQLKSISSSFLSPSNKPGKKLNPKRAGAAWAERRKIELEMEKGGEIVKSDCDANWLPNFGRVWQSGSRKESRKEFEKEKQNLPKVENHSEMPITVQPCISKRMRGHSSE